VQISLKPMTQHYCARSDLNNFVARKLVLFSLCFNKASITDKLLKFSPVNLLLHDGIFFTQMLRKAHFQSTIHLFFCFLKCETEFIKGTMFSKKFVYSKVN